MGKLRVTFTNLFLYIGIIASALLIENVSFLTSSATKGLSEAHFYMLFIVAIFSYLALAIFEHVYNKTKIDVPLAVMLGIFCVGGVIAILTYKDVSLSGASGSVIVSFNDGEKTRNILTMLVFTLTLYNILFTFSKNLVVPRRLSFLYVALIIIGYGITIYSLIKEFNSYKEIFEFAHPSHAIQSGFWNPNAFGGALLMAIGSAILLNVYKKNFFSYISMLIFLVEILFCGSVICLILGTILVLGYLFLELFISLKKTPARNLVLMLFLLLVIGAFIILFIFSLSTDMGGFSKFCSYINSEISKTDFVSLSNRVSIWNGVISLSSKDPLKIIFGYGPGMTGELVRNYTEVVLGGAAPGPTTVHNGVIQIFFDYGIIGCLFYLLVLGYFLYASFKLIKKSPRFVILSNLVAWSLIAYSMLESVYMFNRNVQGLLIGFFFFVPVILRRKLIKHNEYVLDISSSAKPSIMNHKQTYSVIFTILLSLLISILPLLVFKEIRENQISNLIISILAICLTIIVICVPIINKMIMSSSSLKAHVSSAINWGVVTCLITGALIFVITYIGLNNSLLWIIPTLLSGTLIVDGLIVFAFTHKKIQKFSINLQFVVVLFISVVVSLGLTTLVSLFMQDSMSTSVLTYVIVSVSTLLVFYALLFALPSNFVKELLLHFGDIDRYHISKSLSRQNKREEIWRSI